MIRHANRYGEGVQVYIKDERNLMLVKVGRQEAKNATDISSLD